MNTLRRIRFTALLGLAATLLILPPARATTILRPFTGGTTGGSPGGSLTLSGSKLYGMASAGGFNGFGTAFSINTDGTGFVRLHSFAGGASDGREPHGSLTLSGSMLYGTTYLGGSSNFGTVFSMNIDGTGFGLLHSFTGIDDGRYAGAGLTLSGSTLYVMSISGNGTLFRMNTDGTGFSQIHGFNGGAGDGLRPVGSLTLSGSTLYGMTGNGGAANQGTVFSMNTDGTGIAVLHSFLNSGKDGLLPSGSLTLSGSKFYGMTNAGGTYPHNVGTIFSMNTDGTGFTLLHSFSGGTGDGQYPYGSLTLIGSTLYGMTNSGGSTNNGTIFSLNTDGTGYALLESFGVTSTDGAQPGGDLTPSGDGSTLYGMTSLGGVNGAGVIFSKSIVPEPTSAALLLSGTALLALRRRRGLA